MISAAEIREAIKEMRIERIVEAALDYADLLETGQEVDARYRLDDGKPGKDWRVPVPDGGRYLVVRVEEGTP